MRRCSRCGETKPDNEFASNPSSNGRRDVYCRPCRADYKQEHYRANRQRYLDQNRQRKAARLEENMRRLVDYLRLHPCVDCGERDVLVLEFDHLRDKAFGISNAIAYRSWRHIEREIAKCEVVCANCHRRRTARRGRFMRMAIAVAERDTPGAAAG
jgi:hypothetical protein